MKLPKHQRKQCQQTQGSAFSASKHKKNTRNQEKTPEWYHSIHQRETCTYNAQPDTDIDIDPDNNIDMSTSQPKIRPSSSTKAITKPTVQPNGRGRIQVLSFSQLP